MSEQTNLFEELSGIQDAYKIDVKQFIDFMKERHLHLVEGLTAYALWLEKEHDGKYYSPSTINRKIAAAKNRIRYAFKHSSSAAKLREKYQLAEVLKGVKLKKIESLSVPLDKVLSVEEIQQLINETKDITIKLMVMFLISTGVQISEMLAIRLSDLHPADDIFYEIRIIGKSGRKRIIHAKKKFIDRIHEHFNGIVFLFEHDGRPYSRIATTNRIKYESFVIIGRSVSAIQLRHTWALIQIQKGKPISAVAAVLGHSDPGLTVRMYSDDTLEPHEAFLDLHEK
ncbi:MAG: tyrosine-type recombinase/integrase [Spirochaetia bacterium]|nr:tyrosine-type recombinase/integrase [Spirochaetia bacterium]